MSTLAITGATGHLGRLVAEQLSELSPRLIVRDPSRAPMIPGSTVAETTYGDLETSVAALAGIDVLFMVSAAENADRRNEHRTFIRAAAEAGVTHLVYTSYVRAAPDATFTLGRDHHDTEVALAESGIAHTVLRDNFYLDVLPFFAGEDGAIRGPAGHGRVAAVARADVADAAAVVLRDPAAHAGKVYELTGPEALTMDEVAARTSAVLHRELRYVEETVEQAYASRRAAYEDAEDWQLDAWVSTYTAIRSGDFARVIDDVRTLTGQKPRTLEKALAGR